MTATIQKNNPAAPRRRGFRLASMEALGFLENPGATNTWTTTSVLPKTAAMPRTSQMDPAIDPFADWRPSEVGSRLLRGRIRWGLLSVSLLMFAGLVTTGFWVYQRPAALAEEALAGVQASAEALSPELVVAEDLNKALSGQGQMPSTVTAALLTLDRNARELFKASATLPSSETTPRSQAADAASDALDASRLLGTSYAYRAAVIPILAAPAFETDPNLVALDDAARRFGEWQARFDSVRSALPGGALSAITTELAVISGDLDLLQARYLDALRNDDALGATTAVDDLGERLTVTEAMLYSGLSEVQSRVQSRLDQAASMIELLVG